MPTRPTAMTQPCYVHPVRLGWYSPSHNKRLRNRYLLKSKMTHGARPTIDENAQHRSKDYEQAFARLSTEDKTFLRQVKIVIDEPTLEERFHRLAIEWSNEVRTVSSLTVMASHPKYRQIVNLGWDVVPLLIADMKQNKRYWLPALAEITKLRPYDSGDEGNSKIMIDAWVNWGKKKYKNV